MMSKAEFAIAYDGRALENSTMDVQSLGPALLAIGDMCREAHRSINGDDGAKINVHVKATSEGSFDIAFELLQSYLTTHDLFGEHTSTAGKIAMALGLIGSGTAGLLKVLKWKKGRKIVNKKKIKSTKSGNTKYEITVEGDSNNVIIISDDVNSLLSSAKVRAAQRRMLAPLSEDGIDKFHVQQGGKPTFSVKKSDLKRGYFDLDADEVDEEGRISEPQTLDAWLTLRSPVFERDKKWQFVFGDQIITATLKDEKFIRRVFEDGDRFGVGDNFRVRLILAQILQKNGKFRLEYEIDEILETKKGPEQLTLDRFGQSLFSDGDAE